MAKKPTAENKKSVVDVNRDVLAKLLSISVRKVEIIVFEKALKYPFGDAKFFSVDGWKYH